MIFTRMLAVRRTAGLPALALALALLLGALLPAAATAQSSFERTQHPNAPPFYAITNATLVTVSGGTISGGTIVVEDGVITAVGRNVDVPSHVRVIDGTGLTVYPGLVDALTTLGHPDAMETAGVGGRGGFGGGAMGLAQSSDIPYSDEDTDRPASTPWVTFADGLDPQDARLAEWRSSGFTTALSVPADGFFPGQGGMINLAGSPESDGKDMVVKSPVALRVNFQGGRNHRGYPASLMGAIAYVRQTFWDADHYGQAWSLYDTDPEGLERPDYDPVLAPVHEATTLRRPVLFPANNAVHLRRYAGFGRELGLNTFLFGGQEAWAVADDLQGVGGVLVNLDYPRLASGGDPEAVPSLEQLRLIERAPTAAAELARAGVPFAFYTGGSRDPGRALDNIRLTVKAGLAPEVALRALTLGAAEMFGVADRVGSLDVGKTANLTVTEGDLFEDGSQVRMVFVDGVRFPVEPDDRGERMAAADESEGEGAGRGARGGRGAQAAPEWTGVTPMTELGPYQESAVWLITGATVMTGTGETIENGEVLVRDGKIAEVGQTVSHPGDAQVIDADGKWVIPGIIDAHSHIAAEAINEGAINAASMTRISDVLDPTDVSIYRAVAGGVTTVNVLHGSANPIGGTTTVIKNRWGGDADEVLFEAAPAGIKFALGENVKRERNPSRYPASRMGVMDVIRQELIAAQEYMAEWEAYDLACARGETPIPPRMDQKRENMAAVLRGESIVNAHAYRADESLQLLRLAEEFDFKIGILVHILEGYKIADEIAAHGATGSTFSDWWAYKMEAYDAIPYNAALMNERGVNVSINSDSDEEMRHLNQEAAKTMRWGGMTEEQALATITLNPAIQMGIADRVGSLEVGKDADLVIYNGNPLSVFSSVDKTMIDGAIYFDRELDKERQRQLDAEKQTLLQKLRGERRTRPITEDRTPDRPGSPDQGGDR